MKIRAISVKQPWANMIAQGKKTREFRTWRTDHRGPLLIVSSQSPRIEPFGAAVAICTLTDCLPLRDGSYAWVLADVRPVKPFPVKGKLGLYWVQCRPHYT